MAEAGTFVDPFPGFRFVVDIDNKPIGGFSECSGLNVELEVEDYPEGGVNDVMRKLPGRRKQGDLTLKRGFCDLELWRCIDQQYLGHIVPFNFELSIRSFDDSAKEVHFIFFEAFVTRWEGPTFDASQSSVALETLSLCHHGLMLLENGG